MPSYFKLVPVESITGLGLGFGATSWLKNMLAKGAKLWGSFRIASTFSKPDDTWNTIFVIVS